MSRKAVNRCGKRSGIRLLAIRRRAAEWKRRARRAATLALIAAGVAAAPSLAEAQVGQTAMAPAGGIVNRAVTGFQGLNLNGPGYLYYGLNAADRGLGYQGSYMTLGGYFPGFEDDLGGLWAADVRGHVSVYGGFFSNVGAVRKQLLGGSLLGVGVYWDYDGDMNQYADTPILGTSQTFAGGQAYNQVGISGEWLTDFGALRSNGYIPVGSTAQLVGPFVDHAVLCRNGVNAALTGTDLEVGLYVPGLADWAGMISVGGYAYGNARYDFPGGQDAVPWFGGVYTRLDMTFIENWDFSLQYNNDSYFDSTGFARLTYRMGGSRRRNVPDQMEQPMMRNEHIVRAHQTPETAINPANGLPWRVIHVDNTATAGGIGTAAAPFATIGAASAAASAAYDIVFLHVGSSATNPYITPPGGFTFGAPNQYLVGEGSSLAIPTVSCGNRSFFASQAGAYPLITNPLGTAIVMDQPNVTVSHVAITGSPIGISDGATGIPSPDGGLISDVIITGNGGPSQRGIQIANSTGTFTIDNARLSNLTNDGLVVAAAGGVATMANSSFNSITGDAVRVSGTGAVVDVRTTQIAGTAGTAVNVTGAAANVTLTSDTITSTAGDAVVAAGTAARVTVNDSQITATTGSALATSASGTGAVISASRTVIDTTGSPAVAVRGPTSAVGLDATTIRNVAGTGADVSGAGARLDMRGGSRIERTTGDGIAVTGIGASVAVSGRSLLTNIGGTGIRSTGGTIQFVDSTIQTVVGDGIFAQGVNGPAPPGGPTNAVWVQGGTIRNIEGDGIVVIDSNLRVERLDPTNRNSLATTIANTGAFGIRSVADTLVPGTMRVLVNSANISGVDVGISAAANAGPDTPTIELTAVDNVIRTNGGGTGIVVSAVWDPLAGTAVSRVNAVIADNTITSNGGPGILLNTPGGPAQFVIPGAPVPIPAPAGDRPITVQAGSAVDLSGLNNNATVVENPAPVPGTVFSSVNYNPGVIVLLPPPAPPLPPPP